VTHENSKPPLFLHFASPLISSSLVELETSNLVGRLTIASPSLCMTNLSGKGRGHGHVTHFKVGPQSPLEWLKLELSNFVHG